MKISLLEDCLKINLIKRRIFYLVGLLIEGQFLKGNFPTNQSWYDFGFGANERLLSFCMYCAANTAIRCAVIILTNLSKNNKYNLKVLKFWLGLVLK